MQHTARRQNKSLCLSKRPLFSHSKIFSGLVRSPRVAAAGRHCTAAANRKGSGEQDAATRGRKQIFQISPKRRNLKCTRRRRRRGRWWNNSATTTNTSTAVGLGRLPQTSAKNYSIYRRNCVICSERMPLHYSVWLAGGVCHLHLHPLLGSDKCSASGSTFFARAQSDELWWPSPQWVHAYMTSTERQDMIPTIQGVNELNCCCDKLC